MAEDVGERTESATPKRREQARSRGQHVSSRDLTAALILLAGVVGFHLYGEEMVGHAVRLIRYEYASPWVTIDVDDLRVQLLRVARISFEAIWIWGAIVFASSLIAVYAQTGGPHIASEKDYFDLNRLDPIAGLGRIFSRRGLMKTIVDVIKVLVIGSVAYLYMADRLPALASLSRIPLEPLTAVAFEELLTFAYYLIAILLFLGIVDYLYQWFQFEQELKMTKQQVREEARDIDGDPMVKQRRRQIQLQLARQRMMKELPEAEVVITNPTELAVALKYKVEEMDAPVVVAMGAGVFARRIRELAAQYNIPIIENRPLAQLLFHQAEVGRVVPEETFVAVAEILAYVYQITNRYVPPRAARSS